MPPDTGLAFGRTEELGAGLYHDLFASLTCLHTEGQREDRSLWKDRGTWRLSITQSFHQPYMPSHTGAQFSLSLIMCHKLLLRGSGVKKHHISKAFPRKDSEKTVFCLCLQVCKPLSKRGLTTYICIEKRNTVDFVLVRRLTLPFSLFLAYVYTVTENMCLL